MSTYISPTAIISPTVLISDKARIFDRVRISDYVRIFNDATIFEDAEISGSVIIFGDATICGHAKISDDVVISGHAVISGDAIISGNTRISGNAIISGHGDITCINDYIYIGPAPSSGRYTTIHLDKKIGIRINTGCFSNSLEQFQKAVLFTHYKQETALEWYNQVIQFIEMKIKSKHWQRRLEELNFNSFR